MPLDFLPHHSRVFRIFGGSQEIGIGDQERKLGHAQSWLRLVIPGKINVRSPQSEQAVSHSTHVHPWNTISEKVEVG